MFQLLFDILEGYYNNFTKLLSLFASWIGSFGVAVLTIGTLVLVFCFYFFVKALKPYFFDLLVWRLKNAYRFIIAAVLASFLRFLVSLFVDLYNFVVLHILGWGIELTILNPPIPFLWLILTIIFSILSFVAFNLVVAVYVKVEDWAANNFIMKRLMHVRTQLFARGGFSRSDSVLSRAFVEGFFFGFFEVFVFTYLPFFFILIKFYSVGYLLIFMNLLTFSLIFNYDIEGTFKDNYVGMFNFMFFFFHEIKKEKAKKRLNLFTEQHYDEDGNLVTNLSQPCYKVVFDFNQKFYPINTVLPLMYGNDRPDISKSLINDMMRTAAYNSDPYNYFYKTMRVYTYLNNDFLFKHSSKLNKRFFNTSNVLYAPKEQMIMEIIEEGGRKIIRRKTIFKPTHVERLIEEFNSIINSKDKSTLYVVGGAAAGLTAAVALDQLNKRWDRESNERIAQMSNESNERIAQMSNETALLMEQEKTKQALLFKESAKEMEETKSSFFSVFGSKK